MFIFRHIFTTHAKTTREQDHPLDAPRLPYIISYNFASIAHDIRSNLDLVPGVQILPPALGLGVKVRLLTDRDGTSPNSDIVAEVVCSGVYDTSGRYISSHRKIHSQV